MQGLLLGVKLVTCVSLILFSVSCYNMVVRSEEAVDNTQNGGSSSPPVKTDKIPNTVTDKTSALTVVPDSEDDDATVTTEEEGAPDFSNLDVFYPTKDWQEVKPGQAVPKGLHIRLNMDTGQREAKLMEGDGGLKYWNQEGKQGIVNTEKKLFTPEDLKKALKEFRVNKIDDEDTEVRTGVSGTIPINLNFRYM
eukprot:XP_011453692.1 PREDICTED: nucleotide exchange factor SIL1 [Crassostrea gigas]